MAIRPDPLNLGRSKLPEGSYRLVYFIIQAAFPAVFVFSAIKYACAARFVQLCRICKAGVNTKENNVSERQIKITVNGQEQSCPQGFTISDYLACKNVAQNEVVAEHNGSIIKPEAFGEAALKDGDSIEFIRFVGGG